MSSLEKNPEIESRLQPVPLLAEMTSYQLPRPNLAIDLRLDGNEGPLPPHSLMHHLSEIEPKLVRDYPNQRHLEKLFAARFNVAPEQVLVTSGADDALNRAIHTMVGPGKEIIIPVPTFEMVERYTKIVGGTAVHVEWSESAFPLEAVLHAVTKQTRAIVVISPNNPTGAIISRDQLTMLASQVTDALIILDLAYIEFADIDLTDIALKYPQIVMIRTFSKAWGLAGLRVGYAIGSTQTISWMKAVGNPYAVSGLSLDIAAHRLQMPSNDMDQFIERIRQERSKLAQLLMDSGTKVIPPQGNFVFARFQDAEVVWNALAMKGIAVRRFPNAPRLQNALRITCPGNETDFDRLTHALSEILETTL